MIVFQHISNRWLLKCSYLSATWCGRIFWSNILFTSFVADACSWQGINIIMQIYKNNLNFISVIFITNIFRYSLKIFYLLVHISIVASIGNLNGAWTRVDDQSKRRKGHKWTKIGNGSIFCVSVESISKY